MTCTDDALMKILTATKKAVAFDVAWATAQTDKDAEIIGEWFERNA